MNIVRLEQLTWEAVRFLQVGRAGGPIAQASAGDGGMLEVQTFATRVPYLVVERTDHYPRAAPEPDAITWSIRRLDSPGPQQAWLNTAIDLLRVAVGLAELAL
ncbi:MAG: hypothetical protein JO057_21985 [Chloroflexi bacterium]|nr:hypothetical protein [Chloroflexota bacterium]